jgi:hypothetical protein
MNDLLSAILVVEENGRKLSDEQVLSMVETLFAAGHATTRSLIANAMLALLKHPAELAKLRATPTLIASAVEETLRYESPTQAPSPQAAVEEVQLGGKTIGRGDLVTVLYGAANRDPARFADPDRFDIMRADNEHLAFSMGIHYCLGASLARLEAQVAIAAMVARYPYLELTESALMGDVQSTAYVLQALKRMGLHLAVDDFGTGYSSLAYLGQFPIDVLKIDQSFVHQISSDPRASAVVCAIIDMGKNLKQRVIAEGIETQEQLAFLRARRCAEGQGYLFSRPVAADQFAHLLQHGMSPVVH